MDMEQPAATNRDAERSRFISLLKAEGRHNVLEVDAGQGSDGVQFVRAGIHYTGVDPSEQNVHSARAKGLDVSVADARNLPFADGTFSAVWTTGTLLHRADTDIDAVLRELVRVTAPGAPIAVVLSSGEDEGHAGTQHHSFLLLRTPSLPTR
ncbi:class I SAM-dependent methyltransferase [Pseudarthrobacter sulfonivorans]|uniref:class I SAM-dependent methyltransferase n=1 Tax=Pseudarthrobacter sulfonivorans TaxID=121292 RepID=UPI0021054C4D|nr:class I SAM-dependent methyltransferase [Pseudarthrobacter sulfonivorans]